MVNIQHKKRYAIFPNDCIDLSFKFLHVFFILKFSVCSCVFFLFIYLGMFCIIITSSNFVICVCIVILLCVIHILFYFLIVCYILGGCLVFVSVEAAACIVHR